MPAPLKPFNILLVDDREENLIALSAVLASPLYRLKQARSGHEAIEAVKNEDFVVILLDIQMPVMDGFETAAMIRRSERGKDVPIVFVTALDRDPKYIELGFKLGAVDYVFKPYEPLALRAKVNVFADLYQKNLELERSREALRLSEVRFRMLVQGVRDYAIFTLDEHGRVASWNEGAKRHKGYEESEILGKHFSIFYPKEVARSGHPEQKLLIATKVGRYEEEGWRVRKDGSRFWAHVVITAIRDESGKLIGFSKLTKNLTERKMAEERLKRVNEELEEKVERRTAELELMRREAEREREQFQRLANSIPQLAWVAAPDGAVTWYNDRWYEYTGTKPGDVIGWGWRSVQDPNEEERVVRHWKEALAAGVAWEDTFPIRSKEGEWRWFLSRAVPIRNDEGEIIRWFGTNTDIEESRRAKELLENSAVYLENAVRERTGELLKSQTFLDSVIEYLPNMVFVKDAKDLRFVRFNKAGEELLGFSREDLIGKSDYDFFPTSEADFFTSKDREVLAGRSITDIPEEPVQTKYKGTRLLHTRKIPIFGVDGKPEYLLGISEDITEAKQAENEHMRMIREQAALEERKKESQRVIFLAEASTVLASSLDYHRTLQQLAQLVVPALADWCTVTILKEDQSKERVAIVHRDPGKQALIEELSQYYPASSEEGTGIGQVIRTGKSLFTPIVPGAYLVAAAKDARHLEIMRELRCDSCMVVPIITRGKVMGAISIVSATSEHIYNENDLAMAEELGRRAGIAIDNAFLYEAAQKAIRTRDEFMSIASHELKTPITSLKLQLQMTRKATKPEQAVAPSPEKLAKVLDISNAQVNRLTKLVDDLLDVSRIQAGQLSFNFETLDISQLVAEMVDRYADHLKASGCVVSVDAPQKVRVCADRFRMEQVILNLLSNAAKYGSGKPVEISVRQVDGHVLVSCRDRGLGIPAEMIDKVFERFERVSVSSHISGLGLGLYISREIVRAHNGTIRVESEPGKGSVFTVELPVEGEGAAVPGLSGVRWISDDQSKAN